MWLTRTSIQRPIFLTMFVLALFVLGMQSRGRMPAELTPKIDIPYITVSTTYAGAGPAEVETLVSEPIEKAVASVGDLKNVTSSSQDSISTVVLEFEIGTDLEVAAADVRDKVASIRATTSTSRAFSSSTLPPSLSWSWDSKGRWTPRR